jgi:hypothetical protein
MAITLKKIMGKSAEYGAILFFWSILLYMVFQMMGSGKVTPQTIRKETTGMDTLYRNDSAYIFSKRLDTVYFDPKTPDGPEERRP